MLVTTVSETYAREIQESGEFGYGLEGVLRERRMDPPIGILNGIDYEVWNPATDPLIPAQLQLFADLTGKQADKQGAVLEDSAWTNAAGPALLAMISRIDVQKGFDLVVAILDDLLSQDVYVRSARNRQQGNREPACRRSSNGIPERRSIATWISTIGSRI